MQQGFTYCPKCAGRLEYRADSPDAPICSQCGFVLYQNQRVTVAGVIVRDQQLLFCRRKQDPHKGLLDLPGGYVEVLEHPDQALRREIAEELLIDVVHFRLLGVFGPDHYVYQDTVGYNASLHYQVEIGDQVPQASDDVAAIEWYPLSALPKPTEIAFESHRQFFSALAKKTIVLDDTFV